MPDHFLSYLLLGLFIGVFAGMLGIGGGVLVIPALVFLFGFTHTRAVGTSLAMLLPPIGIFALMQYWPDHVNLRAAIGLAIGFALGGYIGGAIVKAGYLSERSLRILFAFFMLYVAGNMLFRADPRLRAAIKTGALVAGFAAVALAARLLGRRLERQSAAHQIYQQKLREPLAPDYEI